MNVSEALYYTLTALVATGLRRHEAFAMLDMLGVDPALSREIWYTRIDLTRAEQIAQEPRP